MVAVASIMAMLLFGILGTTFGYITANRLEGSTEDLESVKAFYIAEGGLQYTAMNYLNGDSDFSDNVSPTGDPFGGTPVSLGDGEFWIEYDDLAEDTITVKITARVGDAVRIVEVTAGQESTGFNYATIAEGNININSGSGDVYGDVALTGIANIDEDMTIHGNITEDPTIEIPTMDMSVYEAMCDDTHVGNKTFNADYTGNLCVTGNVTFNDNVTYTGILYAGGFVSMSGNNVIINGSIIAEGNVSGNNNTGLQFISQTVGDDHYPAIVAGGNVSLQNDDNMTIYGVTWSGGNIDFANSDNVTYTGSFMSEGNVIFNTGGNLTITFDADLVTSVPGMGEIGVGEGSSVSFSNWRTFAPW